MRYKLSHLWERLLQKIMCYDLSHLWERLLQKKWIVSVICLVVIPLAGIGAVLGVMQIRHPAFADSCSGSYYTVQMGNFLSEIAQVKGVSLAALEQANPNVNPNVIYVNQQLCIPGNAIQSAPVSNGGGTGSNVTSIIQNVFGSYAQQAISIATCESSLNPSAYNSLYGAAGLFQIIPGTFAGTPQAGGNVYDAYTNTVAAYNIFARDGHSWREWACASIVGLS